MRIAWNNKKKIYACNFQELRDLLGLCSKNVEASIQQYLGMPHEWHIDIGTIIAYLWGSIIRDGVIGTDIFIYFLQVEFP